MNLERLEEAPTGELIKQAIDDARELVRVEVGLARAQVRTEIKAASRAGIFAGIALASTFFFVTTAVLTLVLALGARTWIALVLTGAFLLVAAITGFVAYRLLPHRPMDDARRRIEGDIRELKEHIA